MEQELLSNMIQVSRGETRTSLNSTSDLAFVNRLPTEMLAKIFVAFLSHQPPPYYLGRSYGISKDCHSWSLVVASVCRYWRDVALKTSQLWRRIYLTGDEDRAQLRIQQALRAKSLPVHLTIELEDDEQPTTTHPSFQTLEHTVKIFDLCFSGDVFSSEPPIKNATAWLERFTSLERLYIGDIRFSTRSPSPLWDRLTHLHVQTSSNAEAQNVLHLPDFPKLISLIVECNSDYGVQLDLPTLFSNAPNLIELILRIGNLAADGEATHERLERVSVYDFNTVHQESDTLLSRHFRKRSEHFLNFRYFAVLVARASPT